MSEDVKLTAAQRQAVLRDLKASGMTIVSTQEWEQAQAEAEQLQRDAAEARWKERERVVDQAIQGRKLSRSQRDEWLKRMALDPEGTRTLLAARPPTAVPGPPLGTDEDLSNAESQGGSRASGAARQGTGLFAHR
jgi:hypothetical protein